MDEEVINKVILIRDKLKDLSYKNLLDCNNDLLLVDDKIVDENLFFDLEIDINKIVREIDIEILPKIRQR